MPFEFHENMVIWRPRRGAWNGFGFFGESRHGKTPLSFAFARMLFVNGIKELRILDDCFKIDDGVVRQCRTWGKRDQLGESHYTQLAEAMSASGHSISEVEPGDHTYVLSNVAAYLLLFAIGDITPLKKQRCSRAEFVENLMPSNPFTWDNPKPGKEMALRRFKENWAYFIVRHTKMNRELIDRLANEAFEDSKRLEK